MAYKGAGTKVQKVMVQPIVSFVSANSDCVRGFDNVNVAGVDLSGC